MNISQSRTEAILDDRIGAQPLIEVRWGQEVTGITQDSTGVTLTSERDVAGFVRRSVRRARAENSGNRLGVTFEGDFDDRFLICDIRADLPGWENERRFYFDPVWNPDRQVLIHPCPDSRYRIDWQVPEDFDVDAERVDGRLDARIRQIVGERPYEIVWQSVTGSSRGVRTACGSAGCSSSETVLTCTPRSAPGPELRGPGRRERGLEARVRPARLGAGGTPRDLPPRAARGCAREPRRHQRDDEIPGAAGRRALVEATALLDAAVADPARSSTWTRAVRRALLVRRFAADHRRRDAPVRRPPARGQLPHPVRASSSPTHP